MSRGTRALSALDVLVALALLALLLWALRLDWRRERPPAAAHSETRSSCTSV
ncbi:MAG TPA: hypothetical protein VKU61_06185 [Candidatus Binatia bacterium]|nr:hypothetical protein [Candidatus Binatia bacterium]